MVQQGVSADVHLERAARHRKVGDALCSAGDEWAAVCYFYSAYHLVQHALLSDPVFDNPTALTAIQPLLTPDHRYTHAHKGRQRSGHVREFGVNELVLQLYRPIASKYNQLHQASIHVRYESGLVLQLDRVVAALQGVEAAHLAGELRAQRPA